MPANNGLQDADDGSALQETARRAFKMPHIFPRDQTVKLLIQCLYDYGYSTSAKQLESESGFSLGNGAIIQFRESILGGEWKKAHALMNNATLTRISEEHLKKIAFLLYEQEYLELLELQQSKHAVQILQNEITPLHLYPEQVKLLSTLIMCPNPEELKRKAGWDGINGQSRSRLLTAIQAFIPPGTMIPEGRLETLLAQATQWQCEHCLYHNNVNEPFSLLSDHCCDRSCFPSTTQKQLKAHDDEVWHVAFSHDGRYLASASKDKTAIIWDTSNWTMRYRLRGHKDAVAFLAFSTNDSMLITSSNDHSLRVWNVHTGKLQTLATHHKEAVACAAWVPPCRTTARKETSSPAPTFSSSLSLVTAASSNSKPVSPMFGARRIGADSPILFGGTSPERTNSMIAPVKLSCSESEDSAMFVSGSLDKTMLLCDLSGAIVHKWTGSRVTDCRVTEDGAWLVSVCQERRIRVHDMKTRNELLSLQESHPVTSISVSLDKSYLIANLTSGPIHLWSLKDMKIVQNYIGHVQGKFVIRSCFGGVLENFVISGSEDSMVYVWSRDSGTIVEKLLGHEGCVNSVAWSSHLNLFASASDDHVIRVWGPNGNAPDSLENFESSRKVRRKKKYPRYSHGTVSGGNLQHAEQYAGEDETSGDSYTMSRSGDYSQSSYTNDDDYYGTSHLHGRIHRDEDSNDDDDDDGEAAMDGYNERTEADAPSSMTGDDEEESFEEEDDVDSSRFPENSNDGENDGGPNLPSRVSASQNPNSVLFIRRWYP